MIKNQSQEAHECSTIRWKDIEAKSALYHTIDCRIAKKFIALDTLFLNNK